MSMKCMEKSDCKILEKNILLSIKEIKKCIEQSGVCMV